MIYSEIRPQFFFMHVFSLKCVGCVNCIIFLQSSCSALMCSTNS